MKLPKSVRIAGVRWKVETREAHPDDDGVFGETFWKTKTIVVYNLPHKAFNQSAKSTFFHEILHAALASTGTDNLCTSKGSEEAIVTALENALWPLIESGLLS